MPRDLFGEKGPVWVLFKHIQGGRYDATTKCLQSGDSGVGWNMISPDS